MIYLTLSLFFAKLSILAIGGLNSTIPAMAQEVVETRHWVTPEQFSQLFAIAQAAPGPNILIVSLLGAHAAGIPGGVLATAASVGPSGVLAVYVAQAWERFREARWRRIVQGGMLPVTAGLMLAAACILVRQSDHSILTVAITAISATMSWRWGTHPVWLLSGGALAGFLLA